MEILISKLAEGAGESSNKSLSVDGKIFIDSVPTEGYSSGCAILISGFSESAVSEIASFVSTCKSRIDICCSESTSSVISDKAKGKNNINIITPEPFEPHYFFGRKFLSVPIQENQLAFKIDTILYAPSLSYDFITGQKSNNVREEMKKSKLNLIGNFGPKGNSVFDFYSFLLQKGIINVAFLVDGSRDKQTLEVEKSVDPMQIVYCGDKIDMNEQLTETLSESNPGIYLESQHAKMIWQGNKDLIIKPKFYKFSTGKPFYLIGGNECYGIIKITKADPINIKEFNELRDRHRISEEERKKWWPGKQILYKYEFNIEKKFDEPRLVKIPADAQTFLRNIEFVVSNATVGMISDIANYDPAKLRVEQLKDDFRIALAWHASKTRGMDIRYSFEEIENLIQLIMEELVKRGIEFHPESMAPNSREVYTKIEKRINDKKLSDSEQKNGRYGKKKVRPDFVDKFGNITLITDVVSLVGSSVEGDDYNDIDLLVRLREKSGFLKRAIETRLIKELPDDLSEKLHFIWGDPEGPHDIHIPLYDLALIRKTTEVVKMNSYEDQSFDPMKPKERFYDVDAAISYMYKNNKDEKYIIEKKYNGYRAVVHKIGDKVKIFSDQKKDITSAFPTVVKQAAEFSKDDFIIDCELVPFKNNDPLGRSEAAQYISSVDSGKKIDDSGIKFYAFDIVLLGKDISMLPLNERCSLLRKQKFGDNIRSAAGIVVDNIQDAKKAIKLVSSMKGSEGAMIKRFNGTYDKGKKSDAWIKFRNEAKIRCGVIEKVKIDAPDTFGYIVGIDIDDNSKINEKYIENGKLRLGKTFNTKIDANVGDVLDIMVEEIWRHKYKDGTIRYSIHKPNPSSISDKSNTSSIDELDSIVMSIGEEVIENEEIESELSSQEEQEPIDFPKHMQSGFLEVAKSGKEMNFAFQWHYRGHEITDEERKKFSIPENYKYWMKSLHTDSRYNVGDHLEGFTLLSPTTTDESQADKIGPGMKNVRVVLKLPQPTQWTDVEGYFKSGEPGTTDKAPAIFVIVAKGTYKPVIVEDHRIVLELKTDTGKVKDTTKNTDCYVDRSPPDSLKSLPKYLSYHIAHIGDRHIILADGVDNPS
jgi:DNA replication protein DnaD